MVGRPAILASGKLGKLCNYGDPACNKCAVETVAQVSGADALSISRVDTTYQFPLDANWKFKKHVQGITRLPDLKGRGRMVLSENTTNRGIHIAFQDIRGATEAVFSNARLLKDRAPFTLINTRRFGNYDHPGGMQSQGEVVAIAMEGPQNPEKYASIIFLKVEGNGFAFVNQLALDGSRGEPQQDRVNIENANAATVGFVQLDNGRYLTAVAGAQHGTKGIWFYESSNTVLGPETTWKYLDFYRPASVGYGSDMDNNYAGAGGGMNFVTDCTGQIYLFAMTGTDGAGRDDETLQVFEVNRNGNSIELTKVAQQKDSFQLAMNNHSFRWSGSVYITRSGRIAVMNSERREGGRADRGEAVDGDVYIGRPPARTNGRRPGD